MSRRLRRRAPTHSLDIRTSCNCHAFRYGDRARSPYVSPHDRSTRQDQARSAPVPVTRVTISCACSTSWSMRPATGRFRCAMCWNFWGRAPSRRCFWCRASRWSRRSRPCPACRVSCRCWWGLVAVQMLFGQTRIWLPDFLLDRAIDATRLRRAVGFIAPTRGGRRSVDQRAADLADRQAGQPARPADLLHGLVPDAADRVRAVPDLDPCLGDDAVRHRDFSPATGCSCWRAMRSWRRGRRSWRRR